MNEVLVYKTIDNKNLFFHYHLANEFDGEFFIFLNPIFDEKKRSQNFMASVGRNLAALNKNVLRFDYYGTDDSDGELYEYSFESTLLHLKEIVNFIFKEFKAAKVSFLGLRMGADIALKYSLTDSRVKRMLLIEPIVFYKRYLLELRLRKKGHHHLYSITDSNEKLEIKGKTYEDFNGYPISEEMLSFFNSNKLGEELHDCEIYILFFKEEGAYKKKELEIKKLMAKKNKLESHVVKGSAFWTNMEPVNNLLVINVIQKIVKRL